MIDPETGTEPAPFTHDQDILICVEHQLYGRFYIGEDWGVVGCHITGHRRAIHH